MNIALTKPMGLADWVKLYRLYLEAFPAAERKPFAMIVSMYRKGKSDVWCLRRGDAFAGLAITINGPDVILLDYLAVAKRSRGEGVGTGALALLQETYQGKGFFLEIESTFENAPNQAQRQKRKGFYLSCGLQEMHVLVKLFGVNMELIGNGCKLDFAQYKAFYRDNYNQWAADHITPYDGKALADK